MTHIVHRNLREAPPIAASGRGIWLRDASGHEVIDGSVRSRLHQLREAF